MSNQFDPWTVHKTPARQETKPFPFSYVDEGGEKHSGEIELTFRSLTREPLAMAAYKSEAQEIITKHVTGTDEKDPEPFIGPNGVVELSRNLVENICLFRQMEPKATRHDFMWWLGLADRLSDTYVEIFQWAQTLLGKPAKGDAEGNSSRTPGSSSSAASSTTTTRTRTRRSTSSAPCTPITSG